MKTVLTKTLVVIAGGALVVPFVAAAVLVGARGRVRCQPAATRS